MTVVERLLTSAEPSVRWKVRVNVCGEAPDSSAVRRLQEEIRRSPRVRRLLAHPGVPNVYAKWQGAHWILVTLADIGYPGGDRSLHDLRDRVLDQWLAPRYFRDYEAKTKQSSYREDGVPVMEGRHRRCASQQGNALYAILRLGIADRRVDRLVERLQNWQWPDGGWNCDRNPGADTSSFVETLWPIRGLALFDREHPRGKLRKMIARAAEVLLSRRLFKRRRDGKVIHPEFLKLHYPPYWHYDILSGLKVMAETGFIGDPRCTDALDLLEASCLSDGGWSNQGRYYRKVSPAIELGNDFVDWSGGKRGGINEWVTADVLAVLRAAGRFRP